MAKRKRTTPDELGRRLAERVAAIEEQLAAEGRPVDKTKDLETRLRERIERGRGA
jgi:hypothetical protein